MKNRIYFLDNLRISAIFLLILLHSAIIFTGWNWHLSSKKDSEIFRVFCLFVHEWRMPLLFFIAGSSSFLSLKNKSEFEFLKDRARRLLIPLFSGIFILVPPQVYIERLDKFSDYISFYPNFFDGIYPEGNFFWHHLWFLGYLFLYSFILYFILKYKILNFDFLEKSLINNKIDLKLKYPIDIISYIRISFLIIFILFIAQVILRPFYFNDTHALFNDWANFSHNFLFFLLGYLYSNYNLYDYFDLSIINNFILGVLSFLLLFLHYYFKIEYNYNLNLYENIIIRFFLKAMMGWFWIAFFIGLFMKFFNYSNDTLKELSIAVYPIYLIHQTIIVVIGYYIINIDINIFLQYIIICLVTIVLSLLFYFLILKKISFLRIFFGIK